MSHRASRPLKGFYGKRPASPRHRCSAPNLTAVTAADLPPRQGTHNYEQQRASRPSVPQRLTHFGWRLKLPLAALSVGLLAVGVLLALTATPPSGDVAAAGIATPEPAQDLSAEDRAVQPETDKAELHCFGSAVMFFEPGLTEEPSPQTITGYRNFGTDLSPTTPCSSPTGIPYKGGRIDFKGSGELACAASGGTLGEVQGMGEIIWDNGDETTAEWTAVSYGALPVEQWTMTDGELEGMKMYVEGVPDSISGNCAENSVTSIGHSGVATWAQEAPEAPEPSRSGR